MADDSEMRKRTFISIGGGELQIPVLTWAKEAGYHVAVTDRRSGCAAAELADEFAVVDGSDVLGLVEFAESVSKRNPVSCVYSGADFGLLSAAQVQRQLGIAAASPAAVELALDKARSKKVWRKNGISTPLGDVASSAKCALGVIQSMELPLIIKPVDSCGSQGVSSIWSYAGADAAVENAFNYSNRVVIEEIVHGRHIDVNGLFIHGEFFPAGIMERFFSDPPFHYSIWGYEPAGIDDEKKQEVYDVLEKSARFLGIEHGPVKGDIILTKNGAIIIELAPRFHGNIISAYLSPFAEGINPIRAFLEMCAGNKEALRILKPDSKSLVAGWRAIFPPERRKIDHAESVKAIKQVEGVYNVFLVPNAGCDRRQYRDNRRIIGFVWVQGDNRCDVEKKLSIACNRLQYANE